RVMCSFAPIEVGNQSVAGSAPTGGCPRLLEDTLCGEPPTLVIAEPQQLGLDPVVVLPQQRPRPIVARRTARDPESVVLIHPRAHRRMRQRHEVITVGNLLIVVDV